MKEDYSQLIEEVVERFGRDRTRMMDIARAIHAKLGCLPEEVMGLIPKVLGIHRVEVRDMASFYAFFSSTRQGKVVVRLCNSVVERMNGADSVARAFEEATGIGFGQTTDDGMLTLQYTACVGLSDQAPSALIGCVPLTNLCPADVPAIVEALKAGKPAGELPQARVDLNLRQRGQVIFAPMIKGVAIRKALNGSPEEVIKEITASRLRGRGGAGFPTGMKWDFCRKAEGGAHYVVCNADEGEPGTFKDRVILSECPDLVFEGMTVAGYALGANEGLLYLRAEYEYMLPMLEQCLAKRRNLGLLGKNIVGMEAFHFDIRIQLGAGAYVCGEESALIESLEGKRGAPRDRPPFPVQKGYRNEPTAVNNVETFCCAARIMEKGSAWFSEIGTKDSTGTKLLSVSGDCERPGVYEIVYGMTVDTLLDLVGAKHAQAVQMAGPSGQCLAPKDYGRSICFEDLTTGGSVIVFGPDRDILESMHQFLDFFVEESCGWCAPCRVGTILLSEVMEKVLDGKGARSDLAQIRQLSTAIKTMSRCGLGQTAANPILTTLKNFSNLWEERIQDKEYVPSFDLKRALQEACAITGQKPHLEDL